MKKLVIVLTFFVAVNLFASAQLVQDKISIEKDSNGIVMWAIFPLNADRTQLPNSSDEFFEQYLGTTKNDSFVKAPHKSNDPDFIHDHFDQYYMGIRVDEAGYNFHYKKGALYYAHGYYIRIDKLDSEPSITAIEASQYFAEYKSISFTSVNSPKAELIIKNIGTYIDQIPKLVYKVVLYSNDPKDNETGYIDAHEGKVLLTEPNLIDYSTTGTFATRYSGSRQATTQYYSGLYHLKDSTRGAVIQTWDMNNSTDRGDITEITDANNNWTSAEYSASKKDMALDVHWVLQEIYDRLSYLGYDSYDNNGYSINAFVRFGDPDNAYWNPDYDCMYFGTGDDNNPFATIDVVAHEFGHGITQFQISGWGGSGETGAFNEGLSDIWGMIMEYRINPVYVWKIADRVVPNYGCLRNIEYPDDPRALTHIADTYNTDYYNNHNDLHIRGGVFSKWFYYLVNGGSGINGLGNSFSVNGVGMNMAEKLVSYAVYNNFLDNTTSWAGIRTSLSLASDSLHNSQINLVTLQVENAFYAVGVGSAPSQISISGNVHLCTTATPYTISNLPTGSTIQWLPGPGVQRVGSDGTNPCNFISTSNGMYSSISARVLYGIDTIIVSPKEVWVGGPATPMVIPSDNVTTLSENYYYTVPLNTSNVFFQMDPNVPYVDISFDSWSYSGVNNMYEYGRYLDMTTYNVGINEVIGSQFNSCSTGPSNVYFSVEVVYAKSSNAVEKEYFQLSPNPANDYVDIKLFINEEKIDGVSYRIDFVNSYSRNLKQVRLNGIENRIDIQDLPSGYYLVLLRINNEVFSSKLIIE